MSDGIEIPIKIPEADATRAAIDQIRASFTGVEREIIRLAEKSEDGKKAMDDLVQGLIDGKKSADDVRKFFAAIASQAPKTSESILKVAKAMRDAADEQTRAAQEAEAERRKAAKAAQDAAKAEGELTERARDMNKALREIALRELTNSFSALEKEVIDLTLHTDAGQKKFRELSKAFNEGKVSLRDVRAGLAEMAARAPASADELRKVSDATKEATRSWGSFSLAASANAFNEVRDAISGMVQSVHSAAQSIATFASESQQLDRAQNDLGLNFARAQQAAGRFTSQLDIMQFASYAANRGLRLHQNELDAITRVAVANAQARGQNVSEVFENMVDGILEGDESLEKLDTRFRALSGDTHTAAERLKALTQFAREVPPAADDAASSFARFEESVRSSARTASRAFVEELAQLQQVASGTRDASAATEEWDTTLRAIGGTIAYIGQMAARGVVMIVSAIGGAVVAFANLGNAAREAAASGARVALENILRGDLTNLTRGVGDATATAFATTMQSTAGGAFETAREQLDALERLTADQEGRRAATAENFTLADARRRRAAGARDAFARTGQRAGEKSSTRPAGLTDAQARTMGLVKSKDALLDHQNSNVDPMDAIRRSLEAERRAMQERREELARTVELRARDLEIARLGVHTETERFEIEQQERHVREEGLRQQNDLEAQQLQSLRTLHAQLEVKREHASTDARRREFADQIRTVHEDEVRLTAEIASHERDIARLTAESANAARERAQAIHEATEETGARFLRSAEENKQREGEREAETREADRRSRVSQYFLEQTNATVNMRDVVVDAYTQMTNAASAHFEALVMGQETAGEALQGFVSDTLKAFAKIASQQAVFELAKGFAALFVNPPAAAAHFGAAALFGVAAAAAGLGAQATAPSSSGKGAASTGATARDREAANVNGRASGGGTVQNVTVMFGGPMYGVGGIRQAGRELAGVLNGAAVQGGTLLNPLLVPQGG